MNNAVILTGNAEEITKLEAFGSLKPDSRFELGNLTQALCASLCAMILIAEEKMTLNSLVTKYLPAFGEEGKEDVTIKQLLKHTSGLPATAEYLKENLSKDEILERIYYEELEKPAGFEYNPSVLDYIVVGAIIEKTSGMPLDLFFEEKVAGPLSLTNTAFASPTTNDQRLTTIFGHTGLISTAEDVWKIASVLLACYTQEQPQKALLIPKPILDEFIGFKARYKLGWNKGEPPFSSWTIGMNSDTGSALWIDLKNEKIVEVFTSDISKLPDYVQKVLS